MGRRRKGQKIDGWVNFYKPYDMTSTQAVGLVRRHFQAQKAGHAGTLDPLATGILPIALGEATKTVPYCQDRLKTYIFEVTWGEQRSTDDAEGDVIDTSDTLPAPEDIDAVLGGFMGNIEQVPPAFSAIKINGERAYDLARAGENVEIKSRVVYVESLTKLSHDKTSARFSCLCGKGTYIRALARDMALKLGTVGYMSALERTSVGPFTTENSISLEILEDLAHSAALTDALLSVETALDDIPALALSEQEANRLKNGQKLTFISRPDIARLDTAGLTGQEDQTALAVYKGKPLALVEICGPEIQPVRVLNL